MKHEEIAAALEYLRDLRARISIVRHPGQTMCTACPSWIDVAEEIDSLDALRAQAAALPDEGWKVGNEFAPFHPDASHAPPEYRDGWNACYEAMKRNSKPYLWVDFHGSGRTSPVPLQGYIPLYTATPPAPADRELLALLREAKGRLSHVSYIDSDAGPSLVKRIDAALKESRK